MSWRTTAGGCDPQQREAITTEARPLCVLAAAGSGKTGCSRVASPGGERRHRLGTVRASAHVHPQGRIRTARPLASLGSRTGDCRNLPRRCTRELRRLAAERGGPPPVVIAPKPSSGTAAARTTAATAPCSLNSPPRSNGRRRSAHAREYSRLPASPRDLASVTRPSSRRSGSATTGEATSRRPRLR